MDLYNEVNKARIEFHSNTGMPLEEIILMEIEQWDQSQKKKDMIKGQQYYAGRMAIDEKKRTVINENGALVEDGLVSNVKLKHGFIKKLVRQKTSYLLSKKMELQSDNDSYLEILETIFDNSFHKLLVNTMNEAINKGIAWIFPYIENDKIKFKRVDSTEVIPLWKDREHTRLDGVIRKYDQEEYVGTELEIVTRVEFYGPEGVTRWVLDGENLIPDVEHEAYIKAEQEDGTIIDYSWGKVPFVYFKYNDLEQPLVTMVDSLIDDYNMQRSLNSDMILDTPNSILHVRNYDGQNPAEFRKNLSTYRIGFTSDDGDMDTLQVTINTEAYEKHIQTTRKDIFEFGGGVNTDFDSFGNSPSGIALEILYQDLDLDCNDIETEFQSSLSYLIYFIDLFIMEVMRSGDFTEEKVEFIFVRNKLSNEEEIIRSLNDSYKNNTLSQQTVTERHPYASENELERLEEEKETLDDEMDRFMQSMKVDDVDENDMAEE